MCAATCQDNITSFGMNCLSLEEAVSVHQNLQAPKTDGYVIWDQNLCMVFDAYVPISLTGIDKSQHLFSVCMHIILLIFAIHQASRPWLKVEVIHATK
jgi:hypothetical protein